MQTKKLFLEIREDLYQHIVKVTKKRKAAGNRLASKVAFIEELIEQHKKSA